MLSSKQPEKRQTPTGQCFYFAIFSSHRQIPLVTVEPSFVPDTSRRASLIQHHLDAPRGQRPPSEEERRLMSGAGRTSTHQYRMAIAVDATLVSPIRRRYASMDNSGLTIPLAAWDFTRNFRRWRRLEPYFRTRAYIVCRYIKRLSAVPTLNRRRTRGVVETSTRCIDQ